MIIFLYRSSCSTCDSFLHTTIQVAGSKDQMVALGMPEFTVEDFFDNFLENLDRLSGEGKVTLQAMDQWLMIAVSGKLT